jgi:hypothetical protein
MLIAQETCDKLNLLIAKTFEMNAFADNAAYNIDFSQYPQTSELYHEVFAHHFPAIADVLSSLMIKLNARPVRYPLPGYTDDYDGNIRKIFEDTATMCEIYRKEIIATIEIAEDNSDFEVKIALEDFLLKFLPYRKQADIWATEAARYEDDYKSFDARIPVFTTFISIPDIKVNG